MKEKAMNELISVVVPVYNVEVYLKECLDSICRQTYSNLEILLVDDGSTDSSGKICDEYAKRDFRIRVIHKRNGGLSDARNTATKVARGKYIAYIDSDDYIEISYLEKLARLINKYNAQIAVCRFRYVWGNYCDAPDGKNQELVFDKHEAMRVLLEEREFGHFAHQKLYLAEIAKAHLYPVGKIYEDVATTYKMFVDADIVAYTQEQLYYYRQRPGSIISSVNKRNFDVMEHVDAIQSYVATEFPDLLPYTNNLKTFYYLHTFARLPDDKAYAPIRSRIDQYIKNNRKKLIRAAYMSQRLKAQIILYSVSKRLYKAVWVIKETKKQNYIRKHEKRIYAHE